MGGFNISMCCLLALLSFASTFNKTYALTYNVMRYGAVGDGYTDDSRAFGIAWRHFCQGSHPGIPVFKVPMGKTFLLTPMRFRGPCNSPNIRVKILGNIVAPKAMEGWKFCKENSWLVFSNIEGLTIVGSGRFDGQGSLWWNNHPWPPTRCSWPTALHFERCNNVRLHGTTHINSPRNHISITSCNHVDLANLRITAPMHSPNTDGIDISFSTYIHVRDSNIRTGDDCVAIGHNSSFINVTNTLCGPGHGISIGSLGAFNTYGTTEEIYVKNCTFKRAFHGVRIKTWEGGLGYAKKITFEDITLEETWNPIIIDQHYCSLGSTCNKNESSAVRVSDVTYRNVHGTTRTRRAINLQCSKNIGCTNLGFDYINITSSVPGRIPYAYCENAQGWFWSSSPTPSCLWK
ncbi:unnamed protein product [Amaranthus hypochondriacus]